MIRSNFHMHTVFCDGKNTPEEMAEAAIREGLNAIGFSGHAYLPLDEAAMSKEGTEEYAKAVRAVAEKKKGRLRVYLGEELDYFSPKPWIPFDYTIGSVHPVYKDGAYISTDWTKQHLIDSVNRYYGGDFLALTEDYFRQESEILEKTGADIVGHFDLVTKFNEDGDLFDESDPRYIAAWQKAADRLLTYGKPFEINTGAISRGYRTTPYPSEEIMKYLRDRGGKFLFSSDSHAVETIAFGRDLVQDIADRLGLDLIDFETVLKKQK